MAVQHTVDLPAADWMTNRFFISLRNCSDIKNLPLLRFLLKPIQQRCFFLFAHVASISVIVISRYSI